METREALEWARTKARTEVGWAIDAKDSGGPDHVAERQAELHAIEAKLCQIKDAPHKEA